jgi:copper transport protein
MAALFGSIILAAPAAAHTGFESSDPADGAVLDGPVTEVVLTFTGEAEPTGGGFEVLEADGTIRQPSTAASEDGALWVLRFDPALTGTVGVRWMVKAPDAHPIDGSFSFTAGGATAPGPEALDDFLAPSDDTVGASRVAGAGRMLTMVGALLGVGALIFAATVLRGHDRDIREVTFWVRRAGLVAALGAVIELVSRIAIDAGGDWSALRSPTEIAAALLSVTGLALVLRLAGGIGLVAGAHPVTTAAAEAPDAVARLRELVGGRGAQSEPDPTARSGRAAEHPRADPHGVPGDRAWVLTSSSTGALVGAAMLVLSFAFDGHTISKGAWPSNLLFTVVHVTAAAAWVGGVAMLVAVCRRRHRRREPMRAAQLAARFTVVATGALVAVGVAGAALAIVVLDDPGELVSTPWGRLLLVKVVIVAAAAGAGGYNHRLLVPELEARPDDPGVTSRFRQVIAAEAAALVLVGLLTAWLVGAAS